MTPDNAAASGLDVVSLFAGIGGIDLAAHRAGMTTRLVCEINAPCHPVLAEHFPDAVIHPDVTELTADDLTRAGAVPRRTVLTAGWPCQGNSVAGRRQGMADGRSGLWSEVARLLDTFRPAWFVGENVPGLLSVNGGRDFGAVIRDLGELGYGFAWRVLDAQYFGVPQRRRRVVIVGRLGDSGRASAEVLFEPEGSVGDHPPLRAPREAVAGTLGGGSGNRGWAPDTDRMTFVPVGVLGDVSHTLTAEGADASEDGTGRGTPVVTFSPPIAATLTAGTSSPGVSAPGRRQEDDANVIAFAWQAGGNNSSSGAFNDDGTTPTLPRSQTLAVALRGREGGATAELGDDKANTLRASQGGGDKAHALIADEVRRLTPLECERLQGFPDQWTAVAGASDSQRYKQLGNSVAVPVFTWVLSRLAAVHNASAEVAA